MLTGTPIDPASGRALPGVRRTIDLEVYEPVLTPHEWVPSVHIPGGGGMTAELAGASLREAAAFFRKYFKKEIRAFICDSWILNPAWMELLPESNLAAFMRELYLFPRTPYPQAGLFSFSGEATGILRRIRPILRCGARFTGCTTPESRSAPAACSS